MIFRLCLALFMRPAEWPGTLSAAASSGFRLLGDGSTDGKLIVVSPDGDRFLSGETIAPTVQAALDHWNPAEAALRGLATRLENGEGEALEGENRAHSASIRPYA